MRHSTMEWAFFIFNFSQSTGIRDNWIETGFPCSPWAVRENRQVADFGKKRVDLHYLQTA